MRISKKQQNLLRMLPGIDTILEICDAEPFFENVPKSVLVRSGRSVVEDLRTDILDGEQDISEQSLTEPSIMEKVKLCVKTTMAPNLIRTVNATGVVVPTNLGRSLLSDDATENLLNIAKNYSNLEFDLAKGSRGSRYSHVENILCEYYRDYYYK